LIAPLAGVHGLEFLDAFHCIRWVSNLFQRRWAIRRSNHFSWIGGFPGIDRILRQTFVKLVKPSSRAATCDTSIRH
jgi:hypothetical protein